MANEETKLCKHCQTEIPKKAKICPNCRKKQGLGCLPIGLIVVAVIIIIGVIMSGSGDKDTGSDQSEQTVSESTNTSTDESSDKDDDKGKEEKKKGKKDEKNYVKEGESFEANGLKITVDDIDKDYEVKDNEYGLYDLDDGYKYIATSYTFKNTGKTDAYVSIYDFDCYADNSNCEQKFLSDGGDFINNNLSSGREVSFTTYYAVPEDAKNIELEYTSNIWTDEKIIIKVK